MEKTHCIACERGRSCGGPELLLEAEALLLHHHAPAHQQDSQRAAHLLRAFTFLMFFLEFPQYYQAIGLRTKTIKNFTFCS